MDIIASEDGWSELYNEVKEVAQVRELALDCTLLVYSYVNGLQRFVLLWLVSESFSLPRSCPFSQRFSEGDKWMGRFGRIVDSPARDPKKRLSLP